MENSNCIKQTILLLRAVIETFTTHFVATPNQTKQMQTLCLVNSSSVKFTAQIRRFCQTHTYGCCSLRMVRKSEKRNGSNEENREVKKVSSNAIIFAFIFNQMP